MTTRCLCLSPEQEELARRWLESQPRDAEVCLLTDAMPSAAVERMRGQFACVKDTLSLPPTDTPDKALTEKIAAIDAEGPEGPRVVVPLSHYSVPMEFRPRLPLPDFPPHYALFRKLWHAGFRGFEVFSLSGTRQFHIPHLLDEFQDCHKGERCFVVGNGPSLNELDMTRLRDEITLGSNRCFLGFDRFGGRFTYWGVYDHYQVQEYGREYEAGLPADIVKFFSFEYLPLLRLENACPVNLAWVREAPHQFSNDPARLYTGFTVTYMLLQIAVIMGCDPIILIGVDHKYGVKRRSYVDRKKRQLRRWASRVSRDSLLYNIARAAKFEKYKGASEGRSLSNAGLWTAQDAAEPTHFDSDYTTDGGGGPQTPTEAKRFLLPEPELAEGDFRCAAQWAAKNGVRILNATPGSALKVFPLVDFENLF